MSEREAVTWDLHCSGMDGNGNGQPLTKAEFFEAIEQFRGYPGRRFSRTDCDVQRLSNSSDKIVEDLKKHSTGACTNQSCVC